MSDCFSNVPADLPKPFDPARAARALVDFGDAATLLSPGALRVFAAAFGNSPFLSRLARREREFLHALLQIGPDAAVASLNEMALDTASAETVSAAMVQLRAAKRRAALAIALADIATIWDVERVTAALTDFADACVKGALRFLLREAATNAEMDASNPAQLEATTGLVVLAMGKYGAFELNYSSDVDLIVFYDADRFPFRKKGDARSAAVDLVKGLVKLMSEITADGYVFRVDLRLRPDAGATQVAISTTAAENYYEAMGQNWERAAMIKARACAGDPQTGEAFLKAIEPFIWRRNLDYAAIEDIHSIKRQIHVHGGHGEIAVAGHNIKLGRGGIREIEFFAQTQQLILGGRIEELRARGTLAALAALRDAGLISADAVTDLTEAYRYFRMLEHRLQMVEDEQTHTVPKSPEGLAHIACFNGFADIEAFSHALIKRLKIVQSHYARLFERAAPLASETGSLVFTGVDDDPETLETLTEMGYRDARHVARAVRGWHHGRVRATRSPRAREILTKLMPALLHGLAGTADPDAAFTQFDRFLSGLPAGVQLFSMFLANPDLLKLVAEISGSAPRLAVHLGQAPTVLDALIDPDFLSQLPDVNELHNLLAAEFEAANDYEGALDGARRFAKEQVFRVGVQIIRGTIGANSAGPAFANIADAVIEDLLPLAQETLTDSAGHVQGGAFAVIAMGKLGGREMTANSDLDLVFVYDAPKDVETSGGMKPLAVSTYYTRLAQRFIAALTTQTAEGGLYEVDMRLRPTGNKGPVAVRLESFANYHAHEAWTWERLALTRARVIAAPDAFRKKLEITIHGALTTQSDAAKLFRDAREMRDKLAAQFPTKNRWDVKYAAGGLVDIEFVTQTLLLHHAWQYPDVLHVNTVSALEKLAKHGVLAEEDAAVLIRAAALQNALLQVLRIAVEGSLDPATATRGLRNLLTRAAQVADFAGAEHALADAQTRARTIFEKILPAVS